MMGIELVPVVEAAAVALAAAAGTGVWNDARTGVMKLFRRGGHDERDTIELLDETDTAVRAAEPHEQDHVRQDMTRDWQVRLRDLVRQHPEIATELRDWAQQVHGGLPRAQQQWVQNITASGIGANAQGVMFGNIINHHAAPPAAESAGEPPSQ